MGLSRDKNDRIIYSSCLINCHNQFTPPTPSPWKHILLTLLLSRQHLKTLPAFLCCIFLHYQPLECSNSTTTKHLNTDLQSTLSPANSLPDVFRDLLSSKVAVHHRVVAFFSSSFLCFRGLRDFWGFLEAVTSVSSWEDELDLRHLNVRSLHIHWS